jgi:DNA primase catalytic subunit
MEWFAPKSNKKDLYSMVKGRKIKGDVLEECITTIRNDIQNDTSLVLNKKKFQEEYKIYYDILFQNILNYRYPRYDGAITYDLNRLIKVPNSVDGSTGRIVQEIKYNELFDIRLNDLLTVDHFV